MKDLGLDSLDQVEIIMAMEDEFGKAAPAPPPVPSPALGTSPGRPRAAQPGKVMAASVSLQRLAVDREGRIWVLARLNFPPPGSLSAQAGASGSALLALFLLG